ncbi:hypothetical protein BS47DRAFT_1337529 [Hydnum rufescens UP504]|uniref:Asp/Glu/hydantoin racemase n=1 Tax=Hydnum rufescens UP504 TaxID=1448309 RepID=A0A9P6E1R6_9AGAM|nr:hypothetical protein BS47DRAFT_1337529 [Hydnum rufescens UP504]
MNTTHFSWLATLIIPLYICYAKVSTLPDDRLSSQTELLGAATRKPVMGILEASVIEALTRGSKFGVLTTGVAWVAPLTKAILELSIVSKEAFAGVVATGLGVLDFHTSSGELGKDDAVENNVRIGAQTLVAKGCNVIVLGCAGMEGMEDAVKAGIYTSKEVRVVDGVRAGVEIIAKKLHDS